MTRAGFAMPDAPPITIRPIEPQDGPAWAALWRGYLDYYETVLAEEVYATTLSRLLAGGPGAYRGLIAHRNGRPVGLVHFLFHRSSWSVEQVCYLQDLYTLPEARGTGVARALIEAVYAAADAAGAPSVYWFTQHFNATARRLYDRIGVLTPFVRYNRPLPYATPPPRPGITIRPVEAGDKYGWRALWQDYLAFYRADLPEPVTAATFARLLADDPDEMRGLVAVADGRPVGLVQFVAHRSCWKIEKVCYLQDLYVLPGARGAGLGRALIEAVYARADRDGTPAVYWLTQDHNATARRLYDRIGALTPFIEYDRPA
jgi:GNAT superfamily N-acetyltransferase